MFLGHLFGLYTHPKQEWRSIDKQHEGIQSSVTHILFIALFPPIFAYISSVYIGWQIGVGEPIFLTSASALTMSIAMYFALIAGVFSLAYLTYWMSHTFGSAPTYTQAVELAAYTATPLFMVSIAAVYPQVWFLMIAGLAGLSYSIYLLYTGVPILMHIPEERGFIYSSSIVTSGLVLLVCIITGSVILWNMGMGPVFSH